MSKSATIERTVKQHVAAAKRVVRLSDEIHARYDAAQTTSENSNHWTGADSLSARASNSPAVRRILRIRCRYEVANSPLAGSILRRAADFIVGTGPRLQVKTEDRAYNRAVERAFVKWGVKAKLARKLWQMRYCRAMNGESIAVFFNNIPMANPVKLDMRMVEADQLSDPMSMSYSDSDGIIFDDFGNPAGYKILKHHPGDTFLSGGLPTDFDTLPAADVLHYFNAERPGQIRGVPEIVAALDLFAKRRRYLNAVIAAAETAADLAVMLQTQAAPDDPTDLQPLDLVDIVQRSMMTLPKGWTAQAFKGEQPQTTLDMFDSVLIREIGRCVDMPYGIAAGDSSSYNFASGKLDHLPWFKRITLEQDSIEDDIADPIFERWFAEASRIAGHLPPIPASLQRGEVPEHQWFWDGQELLDPREAGAQDTALRNGTQTLGRLYGKKGLDATEELEAEAKLRGVPYEQFLADLYEVTFKTQATAAAPTPDQQQQDPNQEQNQ